jgi:hypothetical protein
MENRYKYCSELMEIRTESIKIMVDKHYENLLKRIYKLEKELTKDERKFTELKFGCCKRKKKLEI